MPDSVVGVWRLQSFRTELANGERLEPFGARPRGTLIFHSDGRMAVLMTPGERSAPSDEAEQAAASQPLIAYSGPYRLEPPDRFVTSVDVAWLEPWVGTEQARTYKIEGDRLEIITAQGRMIGPSGEETTGFGILSWVREAPTM